MLQKNLLMLKNKLLQKKRQLFSLRTKPRICGVLLYLLNMLLFFLVSIFYIFLVVVNIFVTVQIYTRIFFYFWCRIQFNITFEIVPCFFKSHMCILYTYIKKIVKLPID